MNANQGGGVTQEATGAQKEGTRKPADKTSADGSETAQKGGKEPAQRQAQHDWENSSKESGE